LVFLAADQTRLQDLDEAVRRYLAWDSILLDKETLDLTPLQVRQAEEQRKSADQTVAARLPETYQWLLVPTQEDPQAEVTWQAIRLSGQEALAARASKKLRSDELLVTSLAGTRLRMDLDRVPLWRGDHVEIRQLAEDFARYLYLPRLKNPGVLIGAVQDGLGLFTWERESFAYADSYDEPGGRYRGLRGGQRVASLDTDPTGLLVKPEVARRQMDAETAPAGSGSPPAGAGTGTRGFSPTPGPLAAERSAAVSSAPRRYHGSITLDPTRVGRDASLVAEEVIAHLAGLPGAEVKVTLEVEAHLPQGAPEHIVRTVTENSRTLKFASHGFESE
jgi:hypothetical protein